MVIFSTNKKNTEKKKWKKIVLQEDEDGKNVCGDISVLECLQKIISHPPTPHPIPLRENGGKNVIVVVIQYYDVLTRIS